MPDIRAILALAIRDHAAAAADALLSIQLGISGRRLDFDGLRVAAELVGREDAFEPFAVEQIAARRLLRSFALALAVRDVPLGQGWEAGLVDEDEPEAEPAEGDDATSAEIAEEEDADANGEEDESDDALRRSNLIGLGRFEEKALAFRCKILLDGRRAGSGFLVGPSTVMTAWHVIAPAEAVPAPRIEVKFADGRRIAAFLPADPVSKCGPSELESRLPANDDEVAELHDFAVLTLKRPVGAALGVARLADAPKISARDTVIVAHFPRGEDFGVGVGVFRKLRGLTSRWGHTVKTREGSSGAACFDSSYRVAGLHQGRVPNSERGRLVPVTRFPPAVLERIARDEAPPAIWSLDGTVEGALVIGRQGFFNGFAAASRPVTRVRGIRIKRIDAAADPSGIPFSYRMLERMVARSLDTALLRISFDSVIPDLADEIARRALEAGLDIGTIGEAGGVGVGQSSPEAVATDRGRRAATALDTLAGTRGLRLWIFLEHPSAVFSEALRTSFEAFVDQAMRLSHLRLVIAGYEAVSIPGLEFTAAIGMGDEGQPGFFVEYIEGFTRGDVEALVRQAAAGLGKEISQDLVTFLANGALADIESRANGVYDAWRAEDAAEALRPRLRELAGTTAGAADEGGADHG
ncbi:MAG TPA: serine protease [Allosphingosinicella sp.]|nr:serine protease [Allosphingosinicella sp.]